MIQIPNTNQVSNNILKVFMKAFLCVISIFLIFDIIGSFVSVFFLLPKNINLTFRVIMSGCLCTFAVISNACGKIIREIVAKGYKVIVDGTEIEVASRYVFACVQVLPTILALWDWASSFFGFTILFSGLNPNNIEGVYSLLVWYCNQFRDNLMVAIVITFITLLTSCAPYMVIKFSEIEQTIMFAKSVKSN